MSRSPRSRLVAGFAVLAILAGSMLGGAAQQGWVGAATAWAPLDHSSAPEDRYDLAGGCYAILVIEEQRYVQRWRGWFAARPGSLADAEPFHFQATDLGSYLLFDSSQEFVSAREGLLGEAAYAVTRSHPGQIAGGVVMEETDRAADALARSELNEALGRGQDGIAWAKDPSELADWTIDGDGPFAIRLAATGQSLATVAGGVLTLAPDREATEIAFEPTTGCATYPEVEVNVDGPILGGANAYQEVRGYLDAHLHMMAFEFLGGRVRCGRPWHRYGVAHALVDCPDHEPGGHGAVLEAVLSGGNPIQGHNTDGWPTFTGWPRYNSLTHEQVYYKWLERAWRGGLRMFVNLLVDNNQLCKVYPFKRNSCNEMDGVRLQAQRIRELERYIDAQGGGPGEGWFRIVTDPFQARRVISEGRLAVVLGIEVSVPLDCGITLDIPRCDLSQVDERLDEVYDLGVRQMELVNKFDNALSGVTGDSGPTGIVVNQGNLGETGRYWRMETCGDADGHAHDRTQMNLHDDTGSPDVLTGRDSLAGGVLALFGTSGAAPVYPEGPHCNVMGLSDLGEDMIRGMVDRGMIFDPDHMSARARTEALDLIEELGHSGIVSSHGWADDTIYPRVLTLGGVVTPYAGDSSGFVEKWRQHREWADERFLFGFGYGADTNGFGAQGPPRGASAPSPVMYPFTGFGGAVIDRQVSGTRAYDVNADGVAHYGLYPDWLEDLRRLAGDEILADMELGPEAYLQMWERAIGIAPDACRADVADLTDAQVAAVTVGMAARDVLGTLGQPSSRLGSAFDYCMTGARTATVTFTPDGAVASVDIV